MAINILIVTNELKYVCGVSNHIKQIINGFHKKHDDFKFYLLCGSIEDSAIVNYYKCDVIINDKLLHNQRNILNLLKSIVLVKTLLTEYNINIVHSHNHYGANVAYYASLICNIKTIQTNNGLLSEVGLLKHFRANYYFVLSERIRNYMVSKHKISSKKIYYMKYGVAPPAIDNQKYHNKKLIVMAASRYEHIKGLDLYIKAAGDFFHNNSKTNFIISGNGSEEKNLVRLNIQYGNIVRFIDPFIEYKELLAKTNIFVFPSRSTEEGLPIVLIEAIMNNCLIVSSDFEGHKDIFPDNYSDLIFKSDNVNDLACKLEYAIENYSQLIHHYMFLYNKIRDGFSVDKMIQDHYDLYSKIHKSN